MFTERMLYTAGFLLTGGSLFFAIAVGYDREVQLFAPVGMISGVILISTAIVLQRLTKMQQTQE